MKNKYEIRGDVTAIFLKSKKYGDMETIIETSSLGKAQEFPVSWRPVWSENTESYYVFGKYIVDGKNKHTRLHRWILDVEDRDILVDHYDHNTLNNKLSNLKKVTSQQNQQNRKGAQKNSKSMIRGVFWNKEKRKWEVNIYLDGKRKYIGRYNDITIAENAAIEARKKYMPYSQDAMFTSK